jgi:hypothetical protein
MKKVITVFGVFLLGSAAHAQTPNGLERIVVEKYYVANAADTAGSTGRLAINSVTYRIYADLKPGYKFQAVYGNIPHPLTIKTTTSFFNNEDYGATTPNGITVTQLKKNTVMLDSWISVGGAGSGKMGILKVNDTDGSIGNSNGILQNADSAAGVAIKTKDGLVAGTPQTVTAVGIDSALAVFNNVSQVGNLFYVNNGAWSALNGATGPDSTNMVLIAQVTTDGKLSFKLNVQIGTPVSGESQNYVADNPTLEEKYLASLTYPLVAPTDVHAAQMNASSGSFLAVYPNPASEELTLSVSLQAASGTSHYSVYDITGQQIFSRKFEGQNQKIDISSLAPGIYFLTAIVDGSTATRKFVKD